MEEHKINKNQDHQIAKKKIYMPPTLTIYGKLTELTAGGSVGQSETSGNTMADMLRP